MGIVVRSFVFMDSRFRGNDNASFGLRGLGLGEWRIETRIADVLSALRGLYSVASYELRMTGWRLL